MQQILTKHLQQACNTHASPLYNTRHFHRSCAWFVYVLSGGINATRGTARHSGCEAREGTRLTGSWRGVWRDTAGRSSPLSAVAVQTASQADNSQLQIPT